MKNHDDAPRGRQCAAARCTNILREHETGPLCAKDERRMHAWMREIPHQMTVLRGSRQRERGDGGRVGTRTAPLPGNEHVLNLLGPAAWGELDPRHLADQCGVQTIAWTLGQWVRLVCEERRLNGPRTWDEETLAAWLDRHIDWCAGQQWAAEMLDELGAMMAAVRTITRVRPRRWAVPRPCPRCHELTLQGEDWEEYVECTGCGSLYTESELCADAPMTLARLHREMAGGSAA